MKKNGEHKPIKKLLAANRSEIAIRVFRSAHEMGIRTVAIYSHEDRYALHRLKADESYPVGKPGEPLRAYLDIDGIIAVAKQCGVDAIHPGYGFLSENPDLARACVKAGIAFVGPPARILERLGDKIEARELAKAAGVQVLSGGSKPIRDLKEARALADKLGYPVMLKAAKGGGGRGMRVVASAKDLPDSLAQAQREALTAFGSSDVFLEKFVARARHLEVQLLGDSHGNLVHLYERDCSLQRRHQKVVEISPAPNLPEEVRDKLCNAALAIGRSVGYVSAGTVEFLLDVDTNQVYFIEVNPRIQVEHTVTEVTTGVDIVKAQILVAQGATLADPGIYLPNQESVAVRGYAFQCRVTTEDPLNQFVPDYGRVTHYRSAGGFGIRLDAGTAFSGATITPYYDSLLVKVTAWARHFSDATRRMERCLQEFRIRGVKTNIPFLINLIEHPAFIRGECTTRFIDETPQLFQFPPARDRATKLLTYLGNVIVNGHPVVKNRPVPTRRDSPVPPCVDETVPPPPGTRQRLLELGPEKFCDWVLKQKRLLLTDTTFRDAHQSLLATRMRTYDMREIADAYARLAPEMFSIEMWGGATFDTAMRFLSECPWQRLAELRQRIPNILFQMLLRASNAVGYTSYPDNVVRAFCKESAAAGIDLFRIFDSLNWEPNLRVAIDAVRESNMLAEVAICYTGDITNPARSKYSLDYYVKLAKRLEAAGAHILAIKDMAGLCKPFAAELLVRTLKKEISIPIHFHTHDTSGVQAASILKASDAGVDIADAASGPMSGLSSQANLDSLVESLRFTPRETGLKPDNLRKLASYWEHVRELYAAFETGQKASTSEVYVYEMPGGQYTNLYAQAQALGVADRWPEVCQMYAEVNQLFGDIVKVTPSSKVVGDMALFMVANNLTSKDVLDSNRELAFPESVTDLMIGRLGQPPGGFPKKLMQRVLRGQKPVKGRPGQSMTPADFEKTAKNLSKTLGNQPSHRDVLSYLLYPRVYEGFARHQKEYSDTSVLPTPVFFYGLQPGEETAFEIEPGKTLIVKLVTIGEPHPDGKRTVFFELNGQPRDATVIDHSLESEIVKHPKADPSDPDQIAAPMPGLIVNVAVQVGDQVAEGQKLLTLEAMKMEMTMYSPRNARIAEVLVKPKTQMEAGDLLVRLE
ncbi:MAG: pyruvate carboxylase [Candidatus Hydrogenedentes bacterium]|nr:pyruvate carboxylase [Candidatus Hydrogenedentota bacterium]